MDLPTKRALQGLLFPFHFTFSEELLHKEDCEDVRITHGPQRSVMSCEISFHSPGPWPLPESL